MSQVEWLPEAIADLDRVHRFWMAKDLAVATRAIARLRQAAALLRDAPELGRPMEGASARELLVLFGAGSYVLRYRVTPSAVVILRVWHSREVVVQ